MTAETVPTCDVAIVGGGPAGLSAAVELKRLGVGSVVVIERGRAAGGIPRHCGHSPFGMREFRRLLGGPEYAERLVARAVAAGVEIQTLTSVVSLAPGPHLVLSQPSGVSSLSARRVLIATGVREKSRAARLIGGTKPGGVLSTGALQGLVYMGGLAPFRRPVILGTELVSFSALLTCRHAGMRPAAMIEPNPRVTAWKGSSLLPRVLGVPLLLETTLNRIEGASSVTAVEVRDKSGRTSMIETDGVIVTGQFLPDASLLRESHLAIDPLSGGPEVDQFLRCSDPTYFAAGNLLRPVETAGWCWAEGRAAAHLIAKSLAGALPGPEPSRNLSIGSDALKYVVPQRIAPGASDGALRHIQVRVRRPARGTLSLVASGRDLWSRRIAALPERRILIPLDRLPCPLLEPATIVLKEELA
jgi:thioredoxin reductase